MSITGIVILLVIAVASIVAWRYFKIKNRFGGDMLIECPENHQRAGVKVDTRYAWLKSLTGKKTLRLNDCTRWPERQNCGQECLTQIEKQPSDCQVQRMLTNWYQGKFCVYCRRPFTDIHWHDHKPALLSPERELVEWQDIEIEKLPEILESHYAVCWNCLIAESFRKEYPDLVTERPWKQQGS
jgi:hypothetical protein